VVNRYHIEGRQVGAKFNGEEPVAVPLALKPRAKQLARVFDGLRGLVGLLNHMVVFMGGKT
jgi:hypothetical protein